MLKKIIIPLILIFLAVALFFFLKPATQQIDSTSQSLNSETSPLLTTLNPAIAAPDFTLTDMDGETHSLASYKGKPVIINFWATWCPPCRAELPSMNRAWKKIKDEGIEMLAVNVGEDEDTIFAFMGNYPIDFTVLLDESGKIINNWPIKGLPTTFVLDKDGKLVYRAIGGREWDSDTLLDMVRKLK